MLLGALITTLQPKYPPNNPRVLCLGGGGLMVVTPVVSLVTEAPGTLVGLQGHPSTLISVGES